MESVKDKFLRYIAVDTQSAEAETVPSTEKQFNLARMLCEELKAMGASDVRLDEEHAYVYGFIPSNVEENIPVLGFVAHMDTSPALSGRDVKARCIANYDGKDICLNEEKQIFMRVEEFPELPGYAGKELIVTDGTTLLGADDKGGIAEIMTMAEFLLNHPEVPHGKIAIAFTPDEEVGHGLTSLIFPVSVLPQHIPWMAELWAASSTRRLMQPLLVSASTAGAFILAARRIRCAMRFASRSSWIHCFPRLIGRSIQRGMKVFIISMP